MNKTKVILLPGSSNPYGSEAYKEVYELIESEAHRRLLECHFVRYPGWESERDGYLSYQTALSSALDACRIHRPSWIIGRSLGCQIAVGILSLGEDWIAQCSGAVLWGPTVRSMIKRLWPTEEKMREEIERYRRFKAFLAQDFFCTLPDLEEEVKGVQCNLRFVRGALDTLNCSQDLQTLAEIHSRSQPSFRSEVVEIDGLGHTVVGANLSEALRSSYFNALFEPFAAP